MIADAMRKMSENLIGESNWGEWYGR
jgi:hypothetical protein